jgi:hypothetical protein
MWLGQTSGIYQFLCVKTFLVRDVHDVQHRQDVVCSASANGSVLDLLPANLFQVQSRSGRGLPRFSVVLENQ